MSAERRDYRVTWTIDVVADSAVAAAQIARKIQLDPFSAATVFVVENLEIDLDGVDTWPGAEGDEE